MVVPGKPVTATPPVPEARVEQAVGVEPGHREAPVRAARGALAEGDDALGGVPHDVRGRGRRRRRARARDPSPSHVESGRPSAVTRAKPMTCRPSASVAEPAASARPSRRASSALAKEDWLPTPIVSPPPEPKPSSGAPPAVTRASPKRAEAGASEAPEIPAARN
jgi:hypothetical protein